MKSNLFKFLRPIVAASAIATLACCLFGQTTLASNPDAYVRSTVGPPWGQHTNEDAMNAVFGSGNWDDLRYETLNPNTLFSAVYEFIFLEGGDNNTNALITFLTNNQPLITNWVNAGGRLFVNAAPNQGPSSFSCGFGVRNFRNNFSGTASQATFNNAIFKGPFTPVGTSWTGGAFAHSIVSGGGIFPIITGTGGESKEGGGSAPRIVLGALTPGFGLVFFGGMTTTNFHNPQPQATNLRKNIIYYAAFTPLCDSTPPVITVPGTIHVTAQEQHVGGQEGAFVTFQVSAVDPGDSPPAAIANPPSGSFFPVGVNHVQVTATDDCGRTAIAFFDIVVSSDGQH